MRTFVTSRPVAQSFTPYRVMSETVRRRMYGRIYPSDAFGPRFPSTPSDILTTAKLLALELMHKLEQESVSVQTPDETHWFSVRNADLAIATEAATAAETVKLGSVHEGAGRRHRPTHPTVAQESNR